MGIKLGRESTYVYPCDIRFPSERTPGQFTTHRVNVSFRSLPTEQSRQMLQEAAAANETAGLDKDILREVVVGWDDGIEDPFNAETLEVAMDNVFVLAGLIEGYRASVSREAAQARKRKN